MTLGIYMKSICSVHCAPSCGQAGVVTNSVVSIIRCYTNVLFTFSVDEQPTVVMMTFAPPPVEAWGVVMNASSLCLLHTHTQPFNGLLSGTTRVGRYQKKHSPAHTHPDHRTSFIIFLHLQRSMASSLFILRAWQSSRTTSVQVLFGLPLGPGPSTSYSMHFFTQSSSSLCLLIDPAQFFSGATRCVMFFRFYGWRHICTWTHADTVAASDVIASSCAG